MTYARLSTIVGFILLGLFSRFLPHPPNFTALNSIALFGACFLGSSTLSLLAVLTVMLITDLSFGFHLSMPFVYLSYVVMIFMGDRCIKGKSIRCIPFYLILSSLIFFACTNFGVWLVDPFYPKTLVGLGICYLAAIPFLVNQIVGDLFYGIALFGCFNLAERFVPAIRTPKPM